MPDSQELLDAIEAAPCLTTDAPPIAARIKASPEDFRVDEVPAYEPSGEGEHLFVHIEKTGLNTPDAASSLAQAAGLDPRSASWAGLKDRHAVTTQWLSFHTPEELPADLEVEGIRVLASARHTNKLRTGHLWGNRFRLVLSDMAEADLQRARDVLDVLERRGVPNYFGAQRFGREGRNLHQAWRWLVEGRRRPKSPFQRKLMVSTLQSALFNLWLAGRIEQDRYDRGLTGDLYRKEETGGMFTSEEREADDERAQAFEITATGPLFGAKMRWPDAESRDLERQLMERWGLSDEILKSFKKYGEGGRRPLRVRLGDLKWEPQGTEGVLEMSLPKGAYATCVVRELTKTGLITAD